MAGRPEGMSEAASPWQSLWSLWATCSLVVHKSIGGVSVSLLTLPAHCACYRSLGVAAPSFAWEG